MLYSTNKKNKSVYFWVIVCIVCLLIFFRITKNSTKPFFLFISKPFISVGVYIRDALSGISSTGVSREDLLHEIQSLKSENELLSLENSTLMQDRALVEEFKNSFGLFPEVLNLMHAHVISKPNQSLYDTILIAKGEADGVAVNQGVFVNKFMLIGLIDSVTQKTATVVLFSNPGRRTSARLERTGYDVTLIGRGGGNMIVEVPKEIETALGDKIVFPEYSNKVIGVIRDIISDDRDADKKLYITLPTNVLTLDHVFIQQ
jgi:cell shape-determining protein MreC